MSTRILSLARGASLLAVLALALPALAAPIKFSSIPEGWTPVKIKAFAKKFRNAQYKVPAAEGDKRGGMVIVYNPMGGSVEANIKRWKGQVTQEKGDPEPKVETKTIGGLKVTIVDLQGTYTPTAMRPNAKVKPQRGARVINAIIESGEGNYFVKFIAPKATAKAQEKNFHSFLGSLTASGKAKAGDKAPEKKPTSRPS